MEIVQKILTAEAELSDEDEALRDSWAACLFALYVPGANIEKCCKAACREPKRAYEFAVTIKEADIGACLEACRGTEYEEKLNRWVMKRALM